MRDCLKINRDEARLLSFWFSCALDDQSVQDEDCELATKIEEYIDQENKGQEDGKRVTENNQRKQTD